jgi:hypothetical protein
MRIRGTYGFKVYYDQEKDLDFVVRTSFGKDRIIRGKGVKQ